MYHKINLPDCAPQLAALTRLARKTIAFGLQNDTAIVDRYEWNGSVQPDLGNRLGEPFLQRHGGQHLLAAARAGFVEHFAKDDQKHVGEWLWRAFMACTISTILTSVERTMMFASSSNAMAEISRTYGCSPQLRTLNQ